MSKTSISIQKWVDALPLPPGSPNSLHPSGSAPQNVRLRILGRDISIQSDDASSHCSSVESVLESRKPDPVDVLLGLGFGPPSDNNSHLGRIPQRFLKPSKLIKDIDINAFLEQQGELRFEPTYGSLPPSPAKGRPKTC
ncbi:protein ITPRID2 [Onthophagus taurus]|uniref:protein ITPRID2 n=1 Tax=Onthophagus taurus TaxID=166361 RepID=UPI000C20F21F|nr:uncharacterized protein LOC111421007 [Onthophagus taurus]